MSILITGTSSGLGHELAKQFAERGDTVYGISRTSSGLNIKQAQCNLLDLQELPIVLNKLIDTDQIDTVILNASMLGNISETRSLTVEEFHETFTVNVLANKVIIDWLLRHNIRIKNIVGISTGASLKTYYGWSLYCTSKSAFKQLLSGYAVEEPSIHFLSLAPGIIKTKMQDYIYSINPASIPSVKKFRDMYDTMDTPDIVAEKIIKFLPNINGLESGSYFDLRKAYNAK